jgi:hypothetical protein
MISPDRIREVCILFFKTKALMLKAEEIDNNNGTFLQPTLELKAAFDHVMRAFAREHGVTKSDSSNGTYADHQLDKSMGHIYRAYFDTADWISINFREQTSDMLEPYDNSDITAVFPAYFTDIKPRLIDYETGISNLRNQKDIAGESDTLFDQYEALLGLMCEDMKSVSRMIPSLEEYSMRRKRKERSDLRKEFVMNWIKYFSTAGFIAFMAWLYSKYWK